MHFTLHLTKACNMQCDYCYAPPRHENAMTFETGRRTLEFAGRLNPGPCGIVFFGGEPLLCKPLIRDLVAEARAMERHRAGQFQFKITTNGLLLDEEFLDFSIRENIFVAMSFDGVREAHDAHRTLPGGGSTYDRLLPKLRLLLRARPYASVFMVVNPDSAPRLVDSVKLLLEEGARYLVVSLNYAANWTESSFATLRDRCEELGDRYVEWTRAGRKFYLSPFEVKLSSHINRHCYRKERCELARRQLSVDPQGFLFPCVQFTAAGPASPWCVGHIDTGIDETARGRLHDQSEADKTCCRDCVIRDRCNNSCGCLNWQTTGSINRISPVLCRYEQMLVPIADRVGRKLYRERNALFLHKHYNSAYPVLSLLEDTCAPPPAAHARASRN